MGTDGVVLRRADDGDVRRVCEFGETHIRPHYTPLIGAHAADEQVAQWWNEAQISTAVGRGAVLVGEDGDRVVAVAQYGRAGADHAIYKLYVDPAYRSHGLGPRLIAAVVEALPPGAGRLTVEHFAGNVRAGAFYEREGFVVERVQPSATGEPALDVVWRARAIVRGG